MRMLRRYGPYFLLGLLCGYATDAVAGFDGFICAAIGIVTYTLASLLSFVLTDGES